MNVIPALEMKGWRTSASDCTGNQIVVKYEFVSSETFWCRLCNRRMQRRGSRQLTVVDTPYMQYDIELQIETPCLFCPHCNKYAVVRPQSIHPKRCMTLRLMGYIARLMQETSARLLSKLLRLSQSRILRADKDILTLLDEVRPICMDGRRALIIDEKYLGRDKKFVTCVIDGGTGEILWLKEGKGTASLDGFFRNLTPEQKEDIEVVSIDRGNAYLKALREHLPHVNISFDPFHIIKNVNDAVDEVRRELCNRLEKEEKKLVKGKRYLFLCGEENLTEDKREELDKILQINQPLQEAYLLKEKLRLVFQFSSFKRCATAFREWISLAEASTLKPFNRLAKTLSRHAQQVLNFFRYRLTSGRIEGMNSMIARIQLKTRGLPSIDYLRLKLRQLTSPSFTRLF